MKHESSSKWVKVGIWISGVLLLLVIVLAVLWLLFKKDLANPHSRIAKPLVAYALKKILADASDGLYHIQYSNLSLDIKSGKGLLTKLQLTPDSSVFRQLILHGNVPNNLYVASIDSITLKNVSSGGFKNGRCVTVGLITIYHPTIKIINKQRNSHNTVAKTSVLKVLVRKLMKGLLVKKIAIRDLTLTYLNENQKPAKHTALKHLNVDITGLAIDSDSVPGLQIARIRFSTPDSLYHINLDGINFSPKSRSLFIRRTAIEPRLNIAAFYRVVRYDKDRIRMVFNGLQANRIDVNAFLKTQQLHVGQITIASSRAEVFNNYDRPGRVPPVRFHKYPHERLQQLALDLSIDTILMHKGFVSYRIRAKKSRGTANFYLMNSESRFHHITNNAEAKKRYPFASAVLNTKVMGAANLNVAFRFNLLAKNGAFSTIFRMGKMDGRALNPLTVPLALTRIDSADIDHMLLVVAANDNHAQGHFDLYYNHMKISLLKPDKNSGALKKRGLLSFFTNLALPNDNPTANGKFRNGPINVMRDPRMSFLGFMYQSMLDGASSSLSGFDQHKSHADQNTILDIGHKVAKPQLTIPRKF